MVDGDNSGRIGKDELKVALLTSEEFKDALELLAMDDSENLFTAIDLDESLEITWVCPTHTN
eukprot:SAG11_NODE_332_length_10621_cov_13.178768_4_plen_62_part_00